MHLFLSDGTKIESQYVIVADGMLSSIGKQLGERQNCNNIGVCVVQEYPLSKTTLDQFFSEKRRVHYHLNVMGVAGYGWVFPKNEHVNISVCEFRQVIGPENQKKNMKKIYQNYLKILKENNIIPSALQADNLKGGIFPTHPVEHTSLERVFLCGDAAGMVNPLTGEGIYNAMVSGEISANVIREALETGATNENVLMSYQTRWRNDFGIDFKRFFKLSKLWDIKKENIVRLFGKDEKLVDIALKHITDTDTIKKYRWKLARRFLYIYLKDRFGLQ